MSLLARLLKFSDTQPRVPAGNPEGGQWTRAQAIAELRAATAEARRVTANSKELIDPPKPANTSQPHLIGVQTEGSLPKSPELGTAFAPRLPTKETLGLHIEGQTQQFTVQGKPVVPQHFGAHNRYFGTADSFEINEALRHGVDPDPEQLAYEQFSREQGITEQEYPDEDNLSSAQQAYVKPLSVAADHFSRSIIKIDTDFAETPYAVDAKLTLYRGISPDFGGKLTVGSKFVDKGFVSTSTDQATAKQFSDQFSLMEIHVARPSRVLLNDYEMEVLLPRGTQFEIWKIDEHDVIHAHAIPPEDMQV